jgi:OFA family oxalate/formate antiporter-like MFS transporter
MYLMFVLWGGRPDGDHNLAPISKDLKIDASCLHSWSDLACSTFAATLDRILNGLTRPFFVDIGSDWARNTMFIAFGSRVGIYLYLQGHDRSGSCC